MKLSFPTAMTWFSVTMSALCLVRGQTEDGAIWLAGAAVWLLAWILPRPSR